MKNLYLKRNENIDVIDLEGEKAVMNIELGKYFVMNEVASFIWESIKEKTSSEDIVTNIMESYEVDRETCEIQTNSCLEKMLDSKIIEYCN